MEQITYTNKINVTRNVDVFIAGGGPSGVAAAVFAARMGASVYLVEESGAFGGAAATMLVPMFMQFGDGENFLAAGIGKEVYDYIAENTPKCYRKKCPPGIPVEQLKLCYDEMMVKSGADFSFFTSVIDVLKNDTGIDAVVCSARQGLFAVKAKIYIDCTGNGELSAKAGAQFKKGVDGTGEMMAATLCAIWDGVKVQKNPAEQSVGLDKAFADGVFTNHDRHLTGIYQIKENIGGSNSGHIYGVDGTDSDSMTRAMIEGRRQMLEYRKYYREYLKGYEKLELIMTAPHIGIRETRRVTGGYELKLEDFLRRAVFDDEIGRFAYPVDIHAGQNTDEGYAKFKQEFETLRYKKGESYGIPYGALVVKGFDNLLVAGKCISTDRYMQSSVRVMPGCYITGQACGTAAAICSKENVKTTQVDVKKVQSALKNAGAYLPNFKE
ncbi:MAG: FAD-dependent oxidoreductase [Ruminococcaceae bacterium]|nr:FAD-dependent oxidoreductase [Oscillospiraceae bacterium]